MPPCYKPIGILNRDSRMQSHCCQGSCLWTGVSHHPSLGIPLAQESHFTPNCSIFSEKPHTQSQMNIETSPCPFVPSWDIQSVPEIWKVQTPSSVYFSFFPIALHLRSRSRYIGSKRAIKLTNIPIPCQSVFHSLFPKPKHSRPRHKNPAESINNNYWLSLTHSLTKNIKHARNVQ